MFSIFAPTGADAAQDPGFCWVPALATCTDGCQDSLSSDFDGEGATVEFSLRLLPSICACLFPIESSFLGFGRQIQLTDTIQTQVLSPPFVENILIGSDLLLLTPSFTVLSWDALWSHVQRQIWVSPHKHAQMHLSAYLALD